jgi:hypothetical protein
MARRIHPDDVEVLGQPRQDVLPDLPLGPPCVGDQGDHSDFRM